MRRRTALFAILLAVFMVQVRTASSQSTALTNDALRRTAQALSPTLTTSALSATFVRTSYAPQSSEEWRRSKTPRLQRTVINEVTANSKSSKEAVFEAREIDSLVKRQATYFATDRGLKKTFSPASNSGTVRGVHSGDSNVLLRLLGPDPALQHGPSLTNPESRLPERLLTAVVASEHQEVVAGETVVVLEGTYPDSDPARSFNLRVLPRKGYALAQMEEYDARGRVLLQYSAADFESLRADATDVWVATKRTATVFTYDDIEGDSVQRTNLDVLKPGIVPAEETAFALDFPPDARVYDVGIGEHLANTKTPVQLSWLSGVIQNPAVPVLTKEKGGEIVKRTVSAYQTAPVRAGEKHGTLSLPKSRLERRLLIGVAGFAAVAVSLLVLALRRRHRKTASNADEQPVRCALQEGGDSPAR